MNQNLQDTLTGTLIGLARASFSNEYKLTPATDQLIIEGLLATNDKANYSDEALSMLVKRVLEEKKRLIPLCFECAFPCGKNNDYDMSDLWEANETTRSLKSHILYGIREMAYQVHQASTFGYTNEEINKFFYRALFAIGENDWGQEELLPYVKETEEMKQKCISLIELN